MDITRRQSAATQGLVTALVALVAFAAAASGVDAPETSSRDKAFAILKEVYGREAVAKGVITIPEKTPEAPRKGRALADTRDATMLIVGFTGDRGHVYSYTNEENGARDAAVIPAAKAREMWEILALLDGAQARAFDPLRSQWVGFYQGSTWLSGARKRRPRAGSEVTSSGDIVRETLRAYAAKKLCELEGVSLLKSGTDYAEALRGLLELALPPADWADGWILRTLLDDYEKVAPAEADSILARIVAMRKQPGPWYYKLPQKARLPWRYLEERRQWLPDRWLELDTEVRRSLDGKSDEEQIRILTELAFPPGGNPIKTMGGFGIGGDFDAYSKMMSARRVLATKFRSTWRDLLVEKYSELDEGGKLNYVPPRGMMDGDARFCVLVAEDPTAPERMAACAQAYLLTGDEELIAKMRAYALDLSETGAEVAADAIGELLKLYHEDNSIGDIPALAREILARPEAYESWPRRGPPPGGDVQVASRIIGNLAPEDPECEELLLDILSRPEKVLPPGMDPSEARRRVAWEVGERGWPGAVDALIAGLNLGGPTPHKTLERAITNALVEIGDAQALPMLEAALEIEKANHSEPLDDPLSRRPRTYEEHLRRAIACLTVATAADPVGTFGRLGPDRRLVEPWVIAKAMTKDELQGLLASDADEAVRTRLFIAIYADGDWQRLLSEARSTGEW